MSTRKKKTRIPIPQEVSDAVLFVSDRTCCICHIPDRPVQIHHIDDDPANNDVANLAVLCVDCHHKTQVRGGFTKTLTPGMVTHYRDEWLQLVQTKKRALLGRPAAPASAAPTRRNMTPEQARVQAARLRSLYVTFYRGVRLMQDYVAELARPWGNDSPQQREERLRGLLHNATSMIDAALDELQVEPGSQDVCSLYGYFLRLLDQYVAAIQHDYANTVDRRAFWRAVGAMGTVFTKTQLDKKVDEIQAAIQKHIQSVDRLT